MTRLRFGPRVISLVLALSFAWLPVVPALAAKSPEAEQFEERIFSDLRMAEGNVSSGPR